MTSPMFPLIVYFILLFHIQGILSITLIKHCRNHDLFDNTRRNIWSLLLLPLPISPIANIVYIHYFAPKYIVWKTRTILLLIPAIILSLIVMAPFLLQMPNTYAKMIYLLTMLLTISLALFISSSIYHNVIYPHKANKATKWMLAQSILMPFGSYLYAFFASKNKTLKKGALYSIISLPVFLFLIGILSFMSSKAYKTNLPPVVISITPPPLVTSTVNPNIKSAQTAPPIKWTPFTDPNGHYSLNVPKKWVMKQNPNDPKSYIFSAKEPFKGVQNIKRFTLSYQYKPIPPSSVAELQKTILSGIKNISPLQTKFHKGFQMLSDLKIYHLYLNNTQVSLHVTQATPQTIIDRLLSSLRILKEVSPENTSSTSEEIVQHPQKDSDFEVISTPVIAIPLEETPEPFAILSNTIVDDFNNFSEDHQETIPKISEEPSSSYNPPTLLHRHPKSLRIHHTSEKTATLTISEPFTEVTRITLAHTTRKLIPTLLQGHSSTHNRTHIYIQTIEEIPKKGVWTVYFKNNQKKLQKSY